MSSQFYYNITESFKSGVDFYNDISVELGSSSINCTSNVSVSVLKIANASVNIECQGYNVSLGLAVKSASCNINVTSDISTNTSKITSASSSTSIQSNLNVIAYKIQLLSSSINIISNLQILVYKEALFAIAIPCDSSLQATSIKSAKAICALSGEVTANFTGRRLIAASCSINPFTIVTTIAGEILLAQINITTGVEILATAIKFAVNDVPDTSHYRTLFVIDDKPLTNQGRTLTSDQSMVFVENKNWNNLKSRYYKRSSSAGRNSFSLSWVFLPSSRYDTVDKRYARDFIRELASDPDVHVLKVINNDSDDATPYTETSYNVFIRDYSETLVRRDLQNDVYYWDCNLTLEEV